MPLYEFGCGSCGTKFEQFLSISARESPLTKPCPHCNATDHITKILTATPLLDPVRMGLIKAPAGFRDVLQNIHERTPGSVLNVDRNIG